MKILVERRKKEVLRSNIGHLVGQDPGSNPFMTYYSPTRMICGSFGTQHDLDKFHLLQQKADKLASRRKKAVYREKRKLRLRQLKVTRKITNLGLDCTRKIVNYMCDNYQYIHASTYKISQMQIKRNSILNARTRRDQSAWQHYSYKSLLSDKMEYINGLIVDFKGEEYTTKQCDSCGHIQNVDGKLFRCVSCSYTVNRDVHGARGHVLKNCTDRYVWI